MTTIGCAIALAAARHERSQPRDVVLVLEERIGPVRCGVKINPSGASFAEFAAPKLSIPAGVDPGVDDAAKALGLTVHEIGFDHHLPSLFSAGVTFAMVPVGSLDALARAKLASSETSASLGATQVFVYARAEPDAPHSFQARMFAPEIGIP